MLKSLTPAMQRLTLLGLSSLIVVAVASCGASLPPEIGYDLRRLLSQTFGLAWLEPVTPIADASSVADGHEVYLQGRVEQQLPLLDRGLYQLADTTGSIWVLSATSPPPVGTSLTVRAVVRYESVLVAGQDRGEYYVEEISRQQPD